MQSIFETLPQLAAYQPTLLVLGALSFIVLLQSFLGAPLAFGKQEQIPGAPLKGDYSLLSFRVLRTHANSVESLPSMGFSILLAIIVGVDAATVNLIAIIHLVFRLAFWGLYYAGVGKQAGGPRTLAYVGGLLANAVLVVMAMVALV